jgi:hypothetical protein
MANTRVGAAGMTGAAAVGLSCLIGATVAAAAAAAEPRAGDERQVLPLPDGSKWGLVDRTGRWVVEPRFIVIAPYWGGRYALAFESDRFAVIDAAGKTVREFLNAEQEEYFSPQWFDAGVLTTRKKGAAHLELLDVATGVSRPTDFTMLQRLCEGLAAFTRDDEKWGYVDRDLKVVIEPTFDAASGFSCGLADVRQGGKYGYIDATGRFAIPPQFTIAERFHEDVAVVIRGNDTSEIEYVDTTGRPLFEGTFALATEFEDGVATVQEKRDGPMGIIDRTGEYVSPPNFSQLKRFSEGLAAAWKRGESGYVDRNGDRVIDVPSAGHLDKLEPFSGGIALVVTREKGVTSARYIDRTGKPLFPPHVSRPKRPGDAAGE